MKKIIFILSLLISNPVFAQANRIDFSSTNINIDADGWLPALSDSVSDLFSTLFSARLNITDPQYNVVVDGTEARTIVVSNSSANLTINDKTMTAADVGKGIKVCKDISKTLASDCIFKGTISAFVSDHVVTLSGTPTASCASGDCYAVYGTLGNATKIQSAITTALNSFYGISAGNFLITADNVDGVNPYDGIYLDDTVLIETPWWAFSVPTVDFQKKIIFGGGTGLTTDTAFVFRSKQGFNTRNLYVNAAGSSCVDMDYDGYAAHGVVNGLICDNVGLGSTLPQTALKISGNWWAVNDVKGSGGYNTFHIAASDITIDNAHTVGGVNMFYEESGGNNRFVGKCDSYSGSCLKTAGSVSSLTGHISSFTCLANNLTAGIDLSGTNIKNVKMSYVGQKNGGTMLNLGATTYSGIDVDLQADNVGSCYTSPTNIVSGVTYGAGTNAGNVNIKQKLTAGITPTVGTVSGNLETAQGGSVEYTAGGRNQLALTATGATSGATQTALFNTSFGYNSMLNATATKNTAFGYSALANLSTGINAVGIGYLAGANVTTGTNNVAVGAIAMGNNVNTLTGGSNSAFGSTSCANLTSGAIGNTCIGYFSGVNSTTANYNTAVGSSAFGGASNSGAGGSNTAIGALSLNSASGSGAIGNTALGYQAGKTITTGQYNVAIGYNVGSTTLTTGSGNILIGTSASVTTPSAGTSNYINIGNTLFGDTASGYIGVNNASPAYTLDVNGITKAYALYLTSTAPMNTASNFNMSSMAKTATDTSEFSVFNDLAVGYNAMHTMTATNSNSVAVGAYALGNMRGVSGFYGNSGGTFYGNGMNNVAIGNGAMQYATATGCTNPAGSSVSWNVAVGTSALALLACSSTWGEHTIGDNTALGDHAGQSLVSGQYNTFVGGDNALEWTFGQYNTVIGGQSGTNYSKKTTGSYNTLLGAYVGNALSSGEYNILIGNDVGSTTEIAGSNNILIGKALNVTASGTSNTLNIANSLYGLGLNSATSKIGVAVAAPTAQLHIRAGTATAGMAPLKFETGTNLATPEAGAVEYDGTKLYYTDSLPVRQTVMTAASGSLYIDSATGALLTITASGTYYALVSTATVAMSSADLVLMSASTSTGNGSLKVLSGGAGKYDASYSASFTASAPGVLGTSYLYVNSTPQSKCSTESYVATASKTATTSKRCLIDLAVGDVVTYRATADTSGTTFTAKKFNLTLTRQSP